MGKTQPTDTKEFKQQAVQLCETSGKRKTHIARDLGISDSALSKWCKEFGAYGEEAFPRSHFGVLRTIEKRFALPILTPLARPGDFPWECGKRAGVPNCSNTAFIPRHTCCGMGIRGALSHG